MGKVQGARGLVGLSAHEKRNQTTGPCNGLHRWWFRRGIVGGAEARECRRDVVTPLIVPPDRGPLAFPSI